MTKCYGSKHNGEIRYAKIKNQNSKIVICPVESALKISNSAS